MENILTGFHAVEERVRSVAEKGDKEAAKKMRVLFDKAGPRVKKILSFAKEAGILCVKTTKEELDKKALSLSELARDHRGVMLVIEGEEKAKDNIVDFEQFLSSIEENASCTVLILDSITDPHNIGAIIRSADQFSADLVVIPNHRSGGATATSSTGDNEVIARSSAGAASWVKIAKVANLVRCAELLKKAGFWIYGADARGERLDKIEFAKKSAIVMGSEGSGIAKLLKEQCDVIASIPTSGKLDSLNVSVAAGVLLYERKRQSLQ